MFCVETASTTISIMKIITKK